MSRSPNNIGMSGRDSVGKFELVGFPPYQVLTCQGCFNLVQTTIKYHLPKLPDGIILQRTILKKPRNNLGIDCGCYAKFHRQIAHIQDNMATKPRCGRIMVGSGTDTYDPICELPRGHKGSCKSSSATDQHKLTPITEPYL